MDTNTLFGTYYKENMKLLDNFITIHGKTGDAAYWKKEFCSGKYSGFEKKMIYNGLKFLKQFPYCLVSNYSPWWTKPELIKEKELSREEAAAFPDPTLEPAADFRKTETGFRVRYFRDIYNHGKLNLVRHFDVSTIEEAQRMVDEFYETKEVISPYPMEVVVNISK